MKKIDRIIIIGFGSIAQALLPLLSENYNSEIIIFDKEIDTTSKKPKNHSPRGLMKPL
jgi:homospermidine synthase